MIRDSAGSVVNIENLQFLLRSQEARARLPLTVCVAIKMSALYLVESGKNE